MSQKPVDQRPKNHNRQDLWEKMMDLKTFTIKELGSYNRIEKTTIMSYLRGLVAAGYLTVKKDKNGSNKTFNTYSIVKKSLDYPKVRVDGSIITQGRGTEQMWRSMRVMKTFTPKDLSIHCSTEDVQVSKETANDYIKYLCRAGYLKIKRPSTTSTQAMYLFIPTKYTGPKPPKIQRVKQVFDPNLNCVVWPVDGGKK